MHYIIALAPPETQALSYIKAAEALYGEHQPSYLLTAQGNASPHITVVQFKSDSADAAKQVWLQMKDTMRKGGFTPFTPSIVGSSFIDGTGGHEGTTWVELSIKRGDEDAPLMKVHYAALEALSGFGLEPLNAHGSNYRPHISLARIVMPEQIKVCPKTLYENPSDFNLEFGLSDENGQYAHNLDTF